MVESSIVKWPQKEEIEAEKKSIRENCNGQKS
jgi:hypothetical protein